MELPAWCLTLSYCYFTDSLGGNIALAYSVAAPHGQKTRVFCLFIKGTNKDTNFHFLFW